MLRGYGTDPLLLQSGAGGGRLVALRILTRHAPNLIALAMARYPANESR